jgi:hypothetical protein
MDDEYTRYRRRAADADFFVAKYNRHFVEQRWDSTSDHLCVEIQHFHIANLHG